VEERATDVLVVGAGPAGCSASLELTRAGVLPVVLERARFPRDKVCGDGLAPRSVRALESLGLLEDLDSMGFRPIHDYRIISTWGESVRAGVPSTFGKGADHAYVVPRMVLDAILAREVESEGARIVQGMRAVGYETDREGMPVVHARSDNGEHVRYRARVVIAADGSRGSFSRTVVGSRAVRPTAVAIRAYMEGVEQPVDALTFVLDQALLPGYGWIFPGGRPGAPANVGVGMTVRALNERGGGLRRLFDYFVSEHSAAGPFLSSARWVSPPQAFPLLMDFPRGATVAGRVLLTGDVANLVDPLSGEGIAYAIESGRAAGAAAARVVLTGDLDALTAYGAAIDKGLGREFLWAHALRRLLALPWGNGSAIRLLRLDEGWARGGMGVFTNSVPVSWMLKPAVVRRAFSPVRIGRVLKGTSRAAE
jgi:geranylgeranyl reductase family protein